MGVLFIIMVYVSFCEAFVSPEVAVGAAMRKLLAESHYKQTLVLIAVDEAHCIPEWLVYFVTVAE